MSLDVTRGPDGEISSINTWSLKNMAVAYRRGSRTPWEATRRAIEAIEDARSALREREVAFAYRYLEKALEQLRCMICHEPVGPNEYGVSPHIKGYVHDRCKEKYGSRMEYEKAQDLPPGAA